MGRFWAGEGCRKRLQCGHSAQRLIDFVAGIPFALNNPRLDVDFKYAPLIRVVSLLEPEPQEACSFQGASVVPCHTKIWNKNNKSCTLHVWKRATLGLAGILLANCR